VTRAQRGIVLEITDVKRDKEGVEEATENGIEGNVIVEGSGKEKVRFPGPPFFLCFACLSPPSQALERESPGVD
jgi:hypothetical protein